MTTATARSGGGKGVALMGLVAVAALAALGGGGSKSPAEERPPKQGPEPGTGGNPPSSGGHTPAPSSGGHTPAPSSGGSVPDSVLERVARVLATGDPTQIRAEAERLKREGYAAQAQQLQAAAEALENANQASGGSNVPSTTTPAPSTTPAPGGGVFVDPEKWRNPLKRGMEGNDVREWQYVINRDGYGAITADGRFGPATEDATKRWQKAHKLDADGKVGPKTRDAIDDGTPPRATPAPSTPTSPKIPPGTEESPDIPMQYPIPAPLKLGATGSKVLQWQQQLRAQGFGVSKNAAAVELFAAIKGGDPEVVANGKFDAATDKATRIFQTDHALQVDGQVGEKTLAVVGLIPLLGRRLLKLGSRGPAVKLWQQQLVNDGQQGIVPDGMFGAVTQTATVVWQRARGLDADGKVGANTIAAIGKASKPAVALPSVQVVDPDKWRIMRRGTSGKDVAEWQAVLVRDGYGPLDTDGRFGPATEEATKRWQRANELKPTGVVDEDTRDQIDEGKPPAVPMRATRVLGSVVQGDTAPMLRAPTQFKPFSPLPGFLPAEVPDEVVPADRSLAARLAHHLFNTPKGHEDRELVKLFQQAHGLNPTGAYSPGTALALVPYGLVPPKPFYWPRKGLLRARSQYRVELKRQALADPQRRDEWMAAANV